MMFGNIVGVTDAVAVSDADADQEILPMPKVVQTITHFWQYAGLQTWFRMMIRNTVAVSEAVGVSNADADQEIVPTLKVVQ